MASPVTSTPSRLLLLLQLMMMAAVTMTGGDLSPSAGRRFSDLQLNLTRGDFAGPPKFKEKYFSQVVDHFSFQVHDVDTFEQRYLILDDHWTRGTGPIFFYTGNEGNIWQFAQNSLFLLELAQELHALLVFAEHRYYGASLPFGAASFQPDNMRLLTIEQALADYAILITELKKQLNASRSPVICFGGSYGGMLSAYMRIRYPNVVKGALASSAPIFSTAGIGDSWRFFHDVTEDYRRYNPACAEAVKKTFLLIQSLAEAQDYQKITDGLSLCDAISSRKDIHQLYGFVRNAFTFMAMLDYPYSTEFSGHLPANPVQVACDLLLSEEDALRGMRDAVGIFYNASGARGERACYDLYQLFVECADPTGCGLGGDSQAWDYQACTEVNLCFESNNETDMFPAMEFSERQREEYCRAKWGITPRPDWLRLQYWADGLTSASNIIFSNGDLDPWANGGVRTSLSPSLVAINMEGAAHHLDLRGSNAADPASVTKARQLEAQIIASWVGTV
ncbi:dipeptidyl peptidase 2 [Erpetoichthys calabaricus]|uniref:dipeptidyl peptidase 2 n=1 Tax=Erpetoichthys calabaricus TaxID=27687 RepID=UPI0022344602|nr:dipeptidyl peptidase 2 [Erpetoichthys calabaricus]